MSSPVTVTLRAGSNTSPQDISAADRDTVDWSKIVNPPSVLAGSGLFGGGSLATDVTIGLTPGSIGNSALASVPANSLKGNNTGSTATPVDLTAAQAAAILPAFTGDSGSGGVKGLVPAPAAGDAAAGKYLDADGTWTDPLAALLALPTSLPGSANQLWWNGGVLSKS